MDYLIKILILFNKDFMLLNIMLLNNLDLFHLHLDNNRTEYLKNSCSALAIVTMAVELQKGKIKQSKNKLS